ncbi:D-alanyl-D-alanine carboxypeptidase [Yimella sp. cx-573]|nr:D-alanyl-D-alanine carboxypeptidase [Yimella sp. cx-573]
MKRVIAAAGAVVLVAGSYFTLDVYDKVPGFFTLAGAPADPVPLPSQSSPAPSMAAPAPTGAPTPVGPLTGPMPTAAQVADALRKPLQDKRFLKDVAMVVRDAQTGTTLFDQGGKRTLIPASTAKLLAAYAVATTMDLEQPFTTKVVQQGDKVVLVAGGDTVLSPDKGDPEKVVGHAGVADLAAQVATALKKQGRTTIDLHLDTSFAPGPMTLPGWKPEYLAMGYTARIAQLGLATERSDPPTAAAADPTRSVQNALIKALAAQGISAKVGAAATTTSAATTLGAVQSAPLIEVLGQAMRDSDNAMIESLTRGAAFRAGVAGDPVSVTRWVTSLLTKDGFDTTGVKLADVCGLSDGTTIPASLLADLVVAGTSGRNKPFQEVLSRESVAGWNGTLHDRYLGSSAHSVAGEVRAKTGSLPDVGSLAGTVVTDSGRLLVFAVVTNGPMKGAGPWPVRAAMDEAVTALGQL